MTASETAAPGAVGGRIGSALALVPLLACCGLAHASPPRRSRWALLGALSLVAGAVLLPSAPAQARSVSVSNISQPNTGTGYYIGGSSQALINKFTTGGTTDDSYALNTVVLDLTGAAGQYNVSIHEIRRNRLGARVGTLTGTASSAAGRKTYTAPASGIVLRGGTSYFLQIRPSGRVSRSIRVTESNTESNTPANAGWSIANSAFFSYGRRWRETGNVSLKFTITATEFGGVTVGGSGVRKAGTAGINNRVGGPGVSRTGRAGYILNSVPEGSSKTYTIKLDSQPSANVTVQSVRSGDSDLTSTLATSPPLTFTPTNWNTPQTVTVNAAQDADAINGKAFFTHRLTSTDITYNNLPFVLIATEDDDEDTTAPTVISSGYSPRDGALNRAASVNLVLTFNEDVKAGSGNITINHATDDTKDRTIAVTNSQVTFNNRQVTINPSTDLAVGSYSVQIASGAIKDLGDNNYAGISDTTTWNFTIATTTDSTGPTISSYSPAIGSTDFYDEANVTRNVAVDSNLVLTFNENVYKSDDFDRYGRRNVIIRGTHWGTVVAVRPQDITVSGTQVTINPPSNMRPDWAYDVEVRRGAFQDAAGNPSLAVSGGKWRFITAGAVLPTFQSALMRKDRVYTSETVFKDFFRVYITFSETLIHAPNLSNSSFTVKKTPQGGVPQTVSLAGVPYFKNIHGKRKLVLTLADPTHFTPVAATDTVTVSYTKPTVNNGRPENRGRWVCWGWTCRQTDLPSSKNNKLKDVGENDVASFTDKPVTNITGDTTPPSFVSAVVTGDRMTITCNEPLDENDPIAIPATSEFTVTVDGQARAVSGVSVSGNQVDLRLSSAVTQGQTVTVAYNNTLFSPYNGDLMDLNGFRMLNQSPMTVRNLTANAGADGQSGPVHTRAPDPVASVNVVHNGSSLAVSWDAAERAIGYDVTYYNQTSGRNARAAWNRAGTSLTIACDSRYPGENRDCVQSEATYTVGVRALNGRGESAWVNSDPVAPRPALSVANATASEPGEGVGSSNLDFVVTLNRAASGTVTVAYATSDGTATAGADYTATSGTLTFQAGDTSKTVSVPVLGDQQNEGSETLTLTLSNATGATISDGDATGTITVATVAAPDPVTSVNVVHNGTSLAVSWPAAARATHYDVTYSGGGANARGAWNRAGTSLTITCDSRYPGEDRDCVQSGTGYIVAVRARNATGVSTWTNSAAVPDSVASVNVVHNGNSLTVTWPAAARATHYDVTYSGGGANARGAWNRAGTSLTITCDSRYPGEDRDCIQSGAGYVVAVRARNAAGASAWTNSPAAAFAVASVSAVHKGSTLVVTWDAVAAADSYHVTYADVNTSSWHAWQLAAQAHTSTSLTVSGVSSTTTYLVAVRPKNASGYGGWVNSAPAAPPALSVANATASEPGEGVGSSNLDFVVTLNRAASGTVTVAYATSDGTATAGADYTATSGTLTFQAGDTSKTVPVPVLGDQHNEGNETMTLTLSNATGAVINSNAASATGTITNAGPIPQAWISRFGRTVAHQVLDAVDARMGSQPAPGLEMTLAGQPVQWPDGSEESQPVADQVMEQLGQWVSISGDGATVAVRSLHENELLANSSFAFGSRSSQGGLFSFWGRGAVTNFEGREGDLTLDGQVTTWLLGTDWSWGPWPDGGEARRSTAGLMLSRSSSDGSYDSTDPGSGSGDVAATLTGVFPWARHRFTERLEAWGTAGYGQGELEVTPKLSTGRAGATLSTDLNLWLAAAGLRGTLLDGGNDGLTLTGKSDVMAVGTSSAQVTGQDGNLAAADATVTQLRLGLEAQRPFSFGNPESDSRPTLTPSLELGLRQDGGDAETGFGLDLGGGITLSHPEGGLQAEVRGRGLLSHAADGFRDQGFSGSLSWQQRPDSDLGAMLSLTQTMGGSSSGGADALLSRVTLEGLATNDDGGKDDLKSQRLDFQLGYGLLAFGDRFVLTPELGLGLYDSGRDYSIGWSLTRPEDGEAFAFSFEVTRRESVNNNGAVPEHGVQLELNTQF